MRKVKGLLVDVTREGVVKEVEFVDTLENIYNLLDVETIDVAVRTIAGRAYDIVCDDEGLLKGRAIPSAFDSEAKPQLVGNLLIVNSDSEGDFTSLTDEQIVSIKERVGRITLPELGKRVEVLMGVDYEK